MDTHDQVVDADDRGISRRTIVRGAVVTAWTAPLVMAVSAAGFAAVSGPSKLISQGTVTRAGNTFTVSVTVQNAGGVRTKALVATPTWSTSAGSVQGKIGAIGAATPSPWTVGAKSWTSNGQLAPGGAQVFTATVTIQAMKPRDQGAQLNGTLTVTFASSDKGSTPGFVTGH